MSGDSFSSSDRLRISTNAWGGERHRQQTVFNTQKIQQEGGGREGGEQRQQVATGGGGDAEPWAVRRGFRVSTTDFWNGLVGHDSRTYICRPLTFRQNAMYVKNLQNTSLA